MEAEPDSYLSRELPGESSWVFDTEESIPIEAIIPIERSKPTQKHADIIANASSTEMRILTYIHLGTDEIAEKLGTEAVNVRTHLHNLQNSHQATPKDLVLAPYFAGLIDLDCKPKDAPESGRRQKTLSPREVEVFALKANGYRKKEIAKELEITYGTVGTHLSAVSAKLGGSSLRTNILYAHQNGVNLDLF